MSANLLHALYDRDPGGKVFRFLDDQPRTLREMRVLVGHVAQALSDCGVTANDRVSMCLEKNESVLILAHACFQIGAVLHPLNTAYTDAEVAL